MDVIGYYGGYAGNAGWIFLIPVALAIVMRMMSRRRMGQRTPGSPAQHFQGTPSRGPTPQGAPPQQARGIAAGWLPDPSGRNDQRYWSGTTWTDHVMSGGVPGTDTFPDPSKRRDEDEPPEETPPPGDS